jgi:hypothetical protein
MKTPLWIAIVTLGALAACSAEEAPAPAATPPAGTQEASEEPLPTPQEEAAKAAETIHEGNADEELRKLEQELGGG